MRGGGPVLSLLSIPASQSYSTLMTVVSVDVLTLLMCGIKQGLLQFLCVFLTCLSASLCSSPLSLTFTPSMYASRVFSKPIAKSHRFPCLLQLFPLSFLPGDSVYMADDAKRQEYLNNEMGRIFAGSDKDMFVWYWNFAQVSCGKHSNNMHWHRCAMRQSSACSTDIPLTNLR